MRAAFIVALMFAFVGTADAQALRPDRNEAFVTLGWAHIFRAEDRGFGNPVDIAGGVRVPLARRVGVEVEFNWAVGLQADPARCGVVGGCEGKAREGLLDATLVTTNIYVRFPRGRVEPFLVGGVGGMWTTSVNSLTTMRGGVGIMSEWEERSVGLAIGFGGGARVALTQRWSVRPEIRIYDSTAMSRTNLAVIRTALGVGYQW